MGNLQEETFPKQGKTLKYLGVSIFYLWIYSNKRKNKIFYVSVKQRKREDLVNLNEGGLNWWNRAECKQKSKVVDLILNERAKICQRSELMSSRQVTVDLYEIRNLQAGDSTFVSGANERTKGEFGENV